MARTVAKKTPARKPQAPSKPAPRKPVAAPVAAAPEATPRKRGRPTNAERAAKASVKPPADVVSIPRGELETLQAGLRELTKLRQTVERRSSKERTIEQILEGAPDLDSDDWRNDYQGIMLPKIYRFTTKGESLEIDEEAFFGNVLLAIPRDSDIGGKGTEARYTGMIACHWLASEDGSRYVGQPFYVSQEELAELWPDGVEGHTVG